MKKLPVTARAALALPLFLAACAGSSSSAVQTAELTFAVGATQADDFAELWLEVADLTLTDSDGTTFDALLAPIAVDFAALGDNGRILGHLTVGDGRFSKATLALDFSGARCVLAGKSTPASLVGPDGNPFDGQLALEVLFPNSGFELQSSAHSALEFDLVLEQSLVIDAAQNTVVIQPVIALLADRADARALLAAGELKSANDILGHFVAILPEVQNLELGTIGFTSDPNTVFQVDGVPYLGLAGVTALAAMPVGSRIEAYGTVDPLSERVLASYVECGSGTSDGLNDVLDGYVVARNGPAGGDAVLSVRGRSVDGTSGTVVLDSTFDVEASLLGTKVLLRGSDGPRDLDDVNVGQRVRVYGARSGFDFDATAPSALIRLLPVRLYGLATGPAAGGVLELDLERIGPLTEDDFTWPDGGATPPDPALFKLDVGALADPLGILSGSAAEAEGLFPAVDDAGSDFAASTLSNRDLQPVTLLFKDRFGGMLTTLTANAGSLSLEVLGTPSSTEQAELERGLAPRLPLPLTPDPLIEPAGSVLCVLQDADTGQQVQFTDFTDFSTALDDALTGFRLLAHLGAVGTYDAANNRVVAVVILAVID